MSLSRIDSLKIKAKLLQKAKKKSGHSIQLKDAFDILAKTAGYSSWRELKASIEKYEVLSPPKARAYWNTWYHSYAEAREHLQEAEGFLLPFEKDYFICDIHYIEKLGIAENDPDLEKVGRDWANPLDQAALQRLLQKIRKYSSL